MSFDCRYKAENYGCWRLKRECEPGQKGCVLKGKVEFFFKEQSSEDKAAHKTLS